MKGLIVLGATGEIGNNVLSICFREKTFDKYFLYARNYNKLKKIKYENGSVNCIVYNMEKGCDIEKVSLKVKKEIESLEEITLLMLAYTIEPIENIGSLGYEKIKKNINVNVFSQVSFIDYFCTIAKKNNIKLKVVFIDSGAAYTPIKGWSLYCSAKAYMSMYLRCLEKEHGLPVVLFEPGVIDTPMQKIIRESDSKIFDRVDEFIDYHEKGILRKPSFIAEELYKRYLLNWIATNIKEQIEK